MAVLHSSAVKVGGLFICLGFIASMIQAAPLNSTCPPDHYLDHGTGGCEHCCDICCNAELKKTQEECQLMCPAYAKRLVDDKVKSRFEDNNLPTSDSKLPSSDGLSGGTIGGIVGGVVIFVAVAAILVFLVRRKLGPTDLPEQAEEIDAVAPLNRPYAGVPEEGADSTAEPPDWRITSSPEAGKCIVQNSRIAQESRDGQQGRQEIAVANGSCGEGLNDENVLPKVQDLPSPICYAYGSERPITVL